MHEQEVEGAADHHGAKAKNDEWSPDETWEKVLLEVLVLEDRISAEELESCSRTLKKWRIS